MIYKKELPNYDVVVDVLNKNGMSVRQLSKLMYGDNTHLNIIKSFRNKPDIRSSTLIKLCNILSISVDTLFDKFDNNEGSTEIPSIVGNNNVINSHHIHNDITALRAENTALRMLNQEKDRRIDDLKSANQTLINQINILLSKLGQNQDSNEL